MSERQHNLNRYVRPTLEAAGATLLLAGASIAVITAYNHRHLTHRSIKLNPFLEKLSRAEQLTYGIGDPPVWAAVHRIHHSMEDVSLFPMYTISRALKWVGENPEKAEGISIPDSFSHLDPYVDKFSREDVVKIGTQADELVKTRMGDSYQLPSDYTREQLNSILNPTKPTYTYPTEPHVGRYTQDDIARLLLTDPHSPVLIPPPELNKPRGVLKRNVTLYSQPARMFRKHPELKEPDLQTEDKGNRPATKLDPIIGALIPSAGVLLRRHKFAPKDFAIAAIAGSAIYAAKVGLVVAGGNIVNSYGHAGELTQKDIVVIATHPSFKPQLNEDGSVSTDISESGFLGRVLSIATLDEVGGQEEHHHAPDKIAYTSKEGLAGALEAPWGEFLEMLAYNRFVPFIAKGPGFDLKPDETRPDQPHPAVKLIQRRRVEQMQRTRR